MFETLLQDLRYAVRGLLRSPGFALTAIATAAVGIGAATAVFSVVDRILFRSLPYPDADRLVSVGLTTPLDINEFITPDIYFDWRKNQQPFSEMTSFTSAATDCDLNEDHPLRLTCAVVEANFFSTLGLTPALGRFFMPEEDLPNGPGVAGVGVLSQEFWQLRFAGDPAAVGRTIRLDGRSVTIVGVLPAGFEMPTLSRPDVLFPQGLNPVQPGNGRILRAFARLKRGVSIEQARAAMRPAFESALQYVPAAYRKEVTLAVRSLRDRQIQSSRLPSWVLLSAVGAVLLIACANIANLLLARSIARTRELAVRAALGAGKGRLIRQTITEALVLGITGGIAGCGLAWLLLRALIAIAPDGIPRLAQAQLDLRVFLFALCGSIASALIFGLAPALQNPGAGFLTGSRSIGVRRVPLRESLVAAQIAISLVLLAGAGVLLRTLWNLQNVPLGIDSSNVVVAELTLDLARYPSVPRRISFYNELEARISAIPGITAGAITDSLPPAGIARARLFATVQVEGQPPLREGTGGMVTWRFVTPGYFNTLRVPIIEGRAFTEADRTPGDAAVILSQTLARRLFPTGDAVGKRLQTSSDGFLRIVGITSDVKNAGPERAADPEFYILRKPTLDGTWQNGPWRAAFVAIRTSLSTATISEWMRKEIAAIDPGLPIRISTVSQRVSNTIARPRFNAFLLGLFAAIGALLAAIGLYGVMAFLVGQRTQEIGVRMALGATPQAISSLILSRATRWILGGAAAGVIGAWFSMTFLRTLVFDVPEHDPWSFGIAITVMFVIGILAAWVPARRAARVDPLDALRQD